MRMAALILAVILTLADVARADEACLLRGRVLGHDGKPLLKARLRPIVPGARSHFTDREGRFAMPLPCGTGRMVDVVGVHHEDLLLPVLPAAGETIEVEIRLRPEAWARRMDSVRVMGDFNGYAQESAVGMARRRDGTYAATIPCDTESLRYQVLGVAADGRPTAGTMADTFFFRAGRPLASIYAGRRPVEIVFDPGRLPRSKRPAEIRFESPTSATARLYPIMRADLDEDGRLEAAYQGHVSAGGDRDSFQWDHSVYAGGLRRRLAAERDPLRRQCLMFNLVRRSLTPSDSSLAMATLDAVPPDSPLWGLAPMGPSATMWGLRQAIGRPDLVRAYAERGSERHPDREVRAGFLEAAMSEARAAGDKDRLGRYLTRMLDEFATTAHANAARSRYAPDRAIRAGQPAPEFAFASLEDSTRSIRISDFRGRHVLIDFWAVWCGPCRAEMPQLHRAWEAYKDRGLDVLSVSFDLRREDVARYRGDRWPMPWRHAFAARGFGGEESAAFEVVGIPKPILLGPDGMIVAAGDELRGEGLHESLARFLGPPGTKAAGQR